MTWNMAINPAKTRRDLYIMESEAAAEDEDGDVDVDGGGCSNSECSSCTAAVFSSESSK